MKPNKILMSVDDCEAICLYLNSGFSLQQAISLIRNRKNQKCMDEILKRLEDGQSIRTVMVHTCPNKYRKILPALLKLLPFSNALQLSVTLTYEQTNFKRQTWSEGVYPLFLFVGTWCGVAIFTYVCFPILLSLMAGFAVKSTSLLLIQTICKVLCLLVFGFMVFFIGCAILLLYKKTKLNAYKTICKLFKGNLIQQYHSNLFARFYVQCMKSGCKTKEILKLLQHISSYPICQLLSQSIQSQLVDGIPFHQAITYIPIDPQLIRVLQIAMTSPSMEVILDGYLITSVEKMKKQVRKITKGFQLVSYSSIAFIVVVVYQVLILPLTLMAQL